MILMGRQAEDTRTSNLKALSQCAAHYSRTKERTICILLIGHQREDLRQEGQSQVPCVSSRDRDPKDIYIHTYWGARCILWSPLGGIRANWRLEEKAGFC